MPVPHGCPSIKIQFSLSICSILTTPNENWGRKVGVIKNLCVYENGKMLKLKTTIFTILVVVVVVVQSHTHNSLTGLAISTKLCEYII